MSSGRWIWLPAALASFILLISCSVRFTEPDRFPEAVRLHDVEPYQQEPEQCGPYALSALLRYMGLPSDPADLADRLYSPGAGGTLTMDLYLEARRKGLDARQMSGSWELLEQELSDHFPVIVLIKYPGLAGRSGHFILVTGYSADPSGLFMLWGDGKVSWMSMPRFMSLWSGSGNWMLAVRRDQEQ